MTKKTLGVVAVSAFTLSLFAGCASVQDQIAKKVAEGVVNQASGGKVTMSDKNGAISFKDNEGNEAQIGGGEQRPASVPAELPSLPNAKGFGWFGSKDGGLFSFTVSGTDMKTACDQMVTMVKAAGWAEDEKGFNMEIAGSKTTLYKKTGFALTLTCAANEGDKTVVITETLGKTESGGSN